MSKNIINHLKSNITVIDARPFPHLLLSNSIWFGIQGIFGGWTTFIPRSEPYLIYDHPKYIGLAEQRLKQHGFSNIMGSFRLLQAESERMQYKPEVISCAELIKNDYTVLDVRRPDEWALGVMKSKELVKLQLGQLLKSPEKLPEIKGKYGIHCKMGYRAGVAYSLLKKYGHECAVYMGSIEELKEIGVKFS